MDYGSYTNAALKGMGDFDSYSNAAIKGMGDFDSYSNAAVRGFGLCDCDSKSYSNAALMGMGKPKRLIKGTKEAKAYMAKLRAMRGKGGCCRGGKKLSEYVGPAMADYLKHNKNVEYARIGKARLKQMKGNGLLPKIIMKSLGYWKDYFTDWHGSRKNEEQELERLRKLKKARGGKFELQDLRDGFLGPIGWIRMARRKKRQREIERLKKELGES